MYITSYPPELKRQLIPLLRDSMHSLAPSDRDEMGIPSYLHRCHAMRWVYWQRLNLALRMAGSCTGTVVDFGCGSGVLLPVLARQAKQVLGIDERLQLSRTVTAHFDLANVELAEAGLSIPVGHKSVDLILALDVLEHLGDIGIVLAEFHRVLSPSGKLVISGPTENFVYRLGRRLAGFSGEYHKRSVYAVLDCAADYFCIRSIRRLFAICPFFLVAQCQKSD